MKKSEQKFQTLFNHYVKCVLLPKHNFYACAFELKDTRGKSYINFSEVKDHQILALQAVKGQGLTYKIDDSGYGQKPFDSIALKNCPAFVVIRYPLLFCLIPIDIFLLEKERSTRRSLTVSRAIEIATTTVRL